MQTACGSFWPGSVGQQVPVRPAWLQVTQEPRQATLQQTPSVQKPEAHSLSLVHTAPPRLGPQLPATQRTPSAQSASDVQSAAQVPVALVQP